MRHCGSCRDRRCRERQRPSVHGHPVRRARYISRNSGGSAVRSAAYNARDAIAAEPTGELFYFRHRDAPKHHEVLLPEGAPAQFAQAGVLWNAAEERKDTHVAREIVLALPADREVSTEDRIALARSFRGALRRKGFAVQFDVHAPTVPTARASVRTGTASDRACPRHRRRGIGRAVAEHQGRYFREHGLDLQVDPTATHAGQHIGPVRLHSALGYRSPMAFEAAAEAATAEP